MPICFIICFIFLGFIFPGNIPSLSLSYFYRYTVIKCQHLPAREQGCTGGKEHVVAGHHQHLISGADAGVGSDDVLCHGVLPICDERGHILLHRHPVSRWGKLFQETRPSGDPEGQAAVLCPDGGKSLLPEPYLADASCRGELEGALIRKKSLS